jgi:hypothetical protein
MPNYELRESEIRALGAGALDAYPSRGPFVARAVRTDDPLADVARTVERQVFEASFGNDASTMAAEYGPYEKDSLFFLVLDRATAMPVGAGRVIEGGGKTLDDAPDRIGVDLSTIVATHRLYEGRIWDFATVAVLPEYRGGRSGLVASSLLYRTFLNAGRRAGVRHVVTMLDSRAYRSMTLLGAPFEAMAGSAPFEYLGSKSTRALYLSFDALEPSIAEQGERLGRLGTSFRGEIRAHGLRRLLTRRIASRISHQVATGEGLDEHVALPALERRRFRGRR